MKLEQDFKDRKGSPDVCPVTGLPVSIRSEWTNAGPGKGYRITISVLGDRILSVKSAGHATCDDIKYGLALADEVEASAIAEDKDYVQIMDVTDLGGISVEARRLYIESIKHKDRIKCMIFCGTSTVFNISVKLAKRINLMPFDIHIVNSYEEALKISADMLEDEADHADPLLEITSENESNAPRSQTLPGGDPGSCEPDQIKRYVDDILDFIKSIKWDDDGEIKSLDVNKGHPFKEVFDAIALIKNDLDDLLNKRLHAEETVRKSEKKYRSVVENANDAIVVIQDDKIRYANARLREICGYEHDEVMDNEFLQYVHPDDRGIAKEIYDKRLNGLDIASEHAYRVLDGKGGERWVETNAVLVDWEEKSAVLVFLNDITQRKQFEENLRENERKYREIYEGISELIFKHDLNGKFIESNLEFIPGFDYLQDKMNSLSVQDMMPERFRPYFRDYLERIRKNGKDDGMMVIMTKDGQERIVEYKNKLISGPDGQEFVQGLAVDVTERKTSEKMREAKIKAEAESRSKSDFLANMSHEIRTPLNGIIGMTELAMETRLDENQKDIIYAINRESDILLSLINDILDFSKIEAERYDLEEIPFDLRVLVEDLAGSFALRSERKGLELISFLSQDVPSLLVGDPGRLRQILANLVGNAMKFTETGEVFIKAELVEQSQDQACIRFSIKDTGIGISEDKQDTIFDIFTQADGSMTRRYGGTGLGLAISRELTKLMGGEIGVESKEGVGSTFWFTAVFPKQGGIAYPRPLEDVDLSTLRVLIVDDNETNRIILMEYLKSWGCVAIDAPDGEGAITVLRTAAALGESFDIIISDYQMPNMTGFELTKEIRTMKGIKKIPIIILTSVGNMGEGKSCRELGIQGYLTKPARRDELRRAILSVLGLSTDVDNTETIPLITRHTLAEESRGNIQILLAEDYPTNQKVAMMHLKKAGYNVDLAENGQQALAACKRKQYDLVLMDIQMPVMDGYDATKKIRELEARLRDEAGTIGASRLNRIPIIAMTAHAMQGFKEKCLEIGMDDYISKPIRQQELFKMVDKWAMASDSSRRGAEFNKDDANQEVCRMDNAPVNFKKAMDEFECSGEFLDNLLEGFIRNVKEQIVAMRKAIAEGDADKLMQEAHSIKGGAANLTADDLSGVAYELEKIGRSGTVAGGLDTLKRLEKEFFRLEQYANRDNNGDR